MGQGRDRSTHQEEEDEIGQAWYNKQVGDVERLEESEGVKQNSVHIFQSSRGSGAFFS